MRTVSIGGNVTGSFVIAGNGNVVNLGGGAAQAAEAEPPVLRVLVVIASPIADASGEAGPGHAPLNVWREWDQLRLALPSDARWEIVRLLPPTVERLDDVLSEAASEGRPFALLHFVGHGGPQGLIVEDELGRERRLSREALADLLEGQGVRLLLLNACKTRPLAEALVKAGAVEAAVATDESIADRAAITFAKRFYERLAAGDAVERALRKARAHVRREHGEAMAQRYHLVGEGGLRLAPRAEGELRLFPYPMLTYGISWEAVERFVGRREAMLCLGRWLRDDDALTFALHGVGGIGKTMLAQAAAVRYAPLGRFRGVIFADTEGRADYAASDLLRTLRLALGIEAQAPVNEEAAVKAAVDLLNAYPLLLILDNLESLDGAASARLAQLIGQIDRHRGTRVLMTLRPREKDPLTAQVPPRNRLHLAQMDRAEAMRLLWEEMNRLPEAVRDRRLTEMAEAAAGLSPQARAEAERAARRAYLPLTREGAARLWAVAAMAFDYPAMLALIAAQLADYRWAEVAQRLEGLHGEPAERLEQFIGRMVDGLAARAPQAAALLCAMLPFRGGAPTWALRAMMAMEEDDGGGGEVVIRMEQGRDGSLVASVEGISAIDFRDRVIQPALRSGLLRKVEAGAQDRYRLEPYVRHYLTHRRCGDEAVQRGRAMRHAALFLPVAQAVEAALKKGEISLAEPPEWTNLAAALAALTQAPPEEGRDRLLVALVRAMPNLLRLTTAATAAQKLVWLEASLAAARRLGDAQGEANVLQAQGDVLAFLDRRDEALSRYEAALQLYRAVGDRLGEANTLRAQGRLAFAAALEADDAALLRRAKAAFDAAVALHHAIGDAYSEAGDRFYRADALLLLGEVEAALEDLRFAEAVFRRLGLPYADWAAQKREAIEAWLREQGEG